jgi:RNA methyltransferase, TrmH family
VISRSHAIAKRLRALRSDRDLRDREGVLVAEGPHLADEALRSGMSIELAIASPRLLAASQGRALAARLSAAGVPLHEASDGTLEGLSDARSPQPVIVLVRRPLAGLEHALRPRSGEALVVVACGIQDPGNLGAIVRAADAAGASGVVTTPGSADLFHPRAVRASAGAIFRLPALEEAVGTVQRAIETEGLKLVGADPRGTHRYDAFDWRPKTALVLGGEGAGLPPELAPHLDARIAVPMRPGTESLSVGQAAAVLLFEAARQRSSSAG